MWYYYALCVVVALGVGIGCGIGFEKLGQYLYFKRTPVNPADAVEAMEKSTQQLVSQGKIDGTVFVGDSITFGYNLDKFFPNKDYINRGISGDITVGVLERLDSTIFALKPKRIIMLIGTNDIGVRYPEKITFENYESIVKKIKETLPDCELIFESVYHVNEFVQHDRYRNNQKVARLNDCIVALCKKYKVKYLDVNK
ncbi:MAG: GDSL-type esterase/lipase family protein, partial [Clostridia bacterium]